MGKQDNVGAVKEDTEEIVNICHSYRKQVIKPKRKTWEKPASEYKTVIVDDKIAISGSMEESFEAESEVALVNAPSRLHLQNRGNDDSRDDSKDQKHDENDPKTPLFRPRERQKLRDEKKEEMEKEKKEENENDNRAQPYLELVANELSVERASAKNDLIKKMSDLHEQFQVLKQL